MFFSEAFISQVKISYRTKHKKHEKLTNFDFFGLQLFTFFHFFLHFLIQCLELMKSVFWEVGTCFFFRGFHVLIQIFVPYKTPKNMKNSRFFDFLIFNFSLFNFFSKFLYSVLTTDEKWFLRSGDMFFFRSFHVLI